MRIRLVRKSRKCRLFNLAHRAVPTFLIAPLYRDTVIWTFPIAVEDLRALGPGAAYFDALLDSVSALPEVEFDFFAHRDVEMRTYYKGEKMLEIGKRSQAFCEAAQGDLTRLLHGFLAGNLPLPTSAGRNAKGRESKLYSPAHSFLRDGSDELQTAIFPALLLGTHRRVVCNLRRAARQIRRPSSRNFNICLPCSCCYHNRQDIRP
ncbi:hypothetical protein V490_05563 [Pseudogymnoascus sp. VKM F-3557]|nr:hypothetical protein V490_05563 [Pseudogymnoascus sp. VKM F-3557]